jgi:hypothetical protein
MGVGSLQRGTWTAGGRDQALYLPGAYHPSVIADVNLVIGPVEMRLRDMGLGAQDFLDVVRALRAVHLFYSERFILYPVVSAIGALVATVAIAVIIMVIIVTV